MNCTHPDKQAMKRKEECKISTTIGLKLLCFVLTTVLVSACSLLLNPSNTFSRSVNILLGNRVDSHTSEKSRNLENCTVQSTDLYSTCTEYVFQYSTQTTVYI